LTSVPTTAGLLAATRVDSESVFATFLAQIAAFIAFLGDFWQFCFYPHEKVRL
jgi:hypothetical protein